MLGFDVAAIERLLAGRARIIGTFAGKACAPAPLCVYGMTKLEGERALAGAGCRHAIVRVQWSYGFNGVNFPVKLVERAAAGGELRVVDDQVGAELEPLKFATTRRWPVRSATTSRLPMR